MEEQIEKMIEDLTKVRPEMLNEEALKLFNTIMAILDERDRLRETNKKQADIITTANIAIKDLQEKLKEYVPISKIEDKITYIKEKYIDTPDVQNINGATYNYYLGKVDILQELLEGE